MNRAALMLMVLGIFGCDVLSPPPKRACRQLARLCELSPEKAADCVKDLEELEQSAGEEQMNKLTECMKSSASCSAAAGCMAGTGLKIMGNELNNFMKGIGRALQK